MIVLNQRGTALLKRDVEHPSTAIITLFTLHAPRDSNSHSDKGKLAEEKANSFNSGIPRDCPEKTFFSHPKTQLENKKAKRQIIFHPTSMRLNHNRYTFEFTN